MGPPGAQVSLEQQAYMLLTEPERQAGENRDSGQFEAGRQADSGQLDLRTADTGSTSSTDSH